MSIDPTGPRIPVATYRLQFNAAFTFDRARTIAPYLASLGISDCYASSYLKAVPGSLHGYDVSDPTQLNPEIGTPEDYDGWVAALSERGMGHILDLVPNHMGIARSANPWWMDVLENGPSSRFAHFFDIEWHPVKHELAEKVLLPQLGDQYGAVLERRELALTFRDGAFVVTYFDDWFPIAPDTYAGILTHGLDRWVLQTADVASDDVDELRSIVTAAEHLPPRTSREPQDIAVRAREKEVIKRRLASLADRQPAIRRFIEDAVTCFNGRPGEPRSFDLLDGLLDQQSYRLAHWRVASEEINYRRFFDVNQLAALRMEDPSVFDTVHRFAFDLVGRRAATGLRIDHVDGLYAPADYLHRLQARAGEALGRGDTPGPALYLVVEKILGRDEPLASGWPVHGTTGYEFAATVNGLFVDQRAERLMDDTYARFIRRRGGRLAFSDLVYATKRQILHETMSGDINSIGHQLNRLSERNRHFRDFTLYSLISTIKDVIASFPVYRTYIVAGQPVGGEDRRYVLEAIASAQRRAPGVTTLVFDFIERLLLQTVPPLRAEDEGERARIIGKLQQTTGPVAAKGIEDTAFYVYNRLLSLNEVGADPTRFGTSPAAVHHWLGERQRQWPAALSTTATHDTKRGEDVRARLNVLSELARDWRAATTRWRAVNRRLKREVHGRQAPDANEEYFIYQTLVGTWPLPSAGGDGGPPYPERLRSYLVKALREAKVNTSWLRPDEAYERAVLRFVDAVLDPAQPFLEAFRPFQRRVAALGIYNGLAQLLVKITAPGVPDFYQGSELWDLSFVDPDNRRPVDYDRRAALLAAIGPPTAERARALFDDRTDGRIKLFMMTHGLRTRRAARPLFDEGDYVPLRVTGTAAAHVFAFARRHGAGAAITCVPRLVAGLAAGPGHDADLVPTGPATWHDTAVEFPHLGAGTTTWTDAFTGRTVATNGGTAGVAVAALFADVPFALLVAR